MREILRRKSLINWADVAGDTVDSVVATFLAVLELIRRGEISIEQEETFGADSDPGTRGGTGSGQ